MKKNETVRIHPATDLFMRGVTHAIIKSIGRKWITLFHQRSGTTHKVSRYFARVNFLGEPMAE